MLPQFQGLEMASCNNSTIPFENFRMPSEPHPLPSLSSDEESFVVLGKSLIPEVDTPPGAEIVEVQSTSIIQEAKKLINNEISLLEQMSLEKRMMNTSSEAAVCSSNSLENQVQSQVQCAGSVKKQSNEDASVEYCSAKTANSLNPSGMEKPAIFDMKKSLMNSLPEIQSLPKWSFGDIQSEEVQAKISQIIEENVRLKDTLLQNNMSMKSHYEKVVAWQEDVQKVHEAHKLKLIEAKDFIDKCRAANLEMAEQLEELNELVEKKTNEIENLKIMLEESKCLTNEKIVQSSDNNLKEFQLDSANKKIKDLEDKLNILMVANTTLKEDKSKLEFAETVSKSENEKLVHENTLLKNENSKLADSIEKNNIDTEKIKQHCVQLKMELEETKKYAMEKEGHHHKLLSEMQAKASSSPELMNLRAQLAYTQERLMQAEQSRATAYGQIAMMTDQMRDLSNQLESHKAHSHHQDEIFALKTQLEVYKSDFEAEKESKEIIKEEKDKLAEDLQNLQRRNQQLQEEIEVVRDNREFVVYPSNNRASAPANETPLMKCPKCSFGFTTIQSLENHVYRCLEIDDHLP